MEKSTNENSKVIVTDYTEFSSLLEKTVEAAIEKKMQLNDYNKKMHHHTTHYVIGLQDISKLLGLSIPTTRKYLQSILRPAIIQHGRAGRNYRYIVDKEKVLALSRQYFLLKTE